MFSKNWFLILATTIKKINKNKIERKKLKILNNPNLNFIESV